jgi:DNA-binding MarR family transcriptional regulator
LKQAYLEIIALVERLHRECLEVIKMELERQGVRDLNSVQAMLLFNIGDIELTVGDLTERGCYLGSNVSYNVKKLTENGYLEQARSRHDRRSVNVRLSAKGRAIARQVEALFDRQTAALVEAQIGSDDLESSREILRRLEQFWASSLGFRWRLPSMPGVVTLTPSE